MRLTFAILLLAVSQCLPASWVTLTVTVTNAATGTTNGDSLTIQSDTRTFTNDVSGSPSTLIQSTNGYLLDTTNIFLHYSLYSVGTGSNRLFVSQSDSNVIRFRSQPGQTVSASVSGSWGTVALSTNTTGENVVVRVPIDSHIENERTNIISDLLAAAQYSTNALATNTTAVSNLVQVSGDQRITGAKTFAGTINGTVGNITNGTTHGTAISNATYIHGTIAQLSGGWISGAGISGSTLTNGVNRGTAFKSIGTGTDSEQYGNGATATNESTIAIGALARAHGLRSVAIGKSSYSFAGGGTAIGWAAGVDTTATNGTAIGWNSYTDGTNSTAIGANAYAYYNNSIAIGASVQTDDENQAIFGNSDNNVIIPGVLNAAMQTNSLLRGTNEVDGSWHWKHTAINTVAAGNNALSPAVNATYLYLSGNPGAAFAICSITNWAPGKMLIIENNTSYTMTIAHESGYDAYESNRIVTALSGDVTVTGRHVAILFYNATSFRWVLAYPRGEIVNTAAQVIGAGTDYSLTTTHTNLDFGTTDCQVTLPAAGTYRLDYTVHWDTGANAADSFLYSIHNTSNDTSVPGAWCHEDNLVANQHQTVTKSAVYTATNAATLQVWGSNSTGARGSVVSTNTTISYVRLY